MRRRLFTIASAVSLLLCVASAGFWARSYFVADDVSWWSWWHGVGVMSIRGRLICWQATALPPGGVSVAAGMRWSNSVKPSAGLPQPGGSLFWPREEIGFGVLRDPRFVARELYLPQGMLALALAILPICWARLRRRTWAPEGFCAACGYDLRASTGRCPECGTPIRPRRAPGRIRGISD